MSFTVIADDKCVCGYHYKELCHNDSFDSYATKGSEEFTKIEGSFIAKTGFYKDRIINLTLIICPMCGTVKMRT